MTVTFEPLRVVLDRMFEEVLHSIGHVRWELRRMGLQVLPLLCTTALWYEMSLLQDIWQRWLLLPHRDSGTNHPSKDPPYSYAGVLALREIVKKVCVVMMVCARGYRSDLNMCFSLANLGLAPIKCLPPACASPEDMVYREQVLEYCDFVRSAPGSVLPAHTVRRAAY